ncbi:MAG: tetratricopeptide repeat protein [Bacteroidota bacterium]
MRKLILTSSLLCSTLVVVAQKSNETSAAVEYKNKYLMAVATGDKEAAKAALIAAKGYIDLAAVHEDTKDSPKTLYYKGEIYSSFLMYPMMTMDMDTTFIMKGGEDALEVAIASYKKGFDISDKFDIDIKDAINQKKALLGQFTDMMYNNNMFNEAGEMYLTQYQLSDAIKQVDTVSAFNSGICYDKAELFEKAGDSYSLAAKGGYKGSFPNSSTTFALASQAYRKAKNIAKAKEILAEGRKIYPNEKELLLESVNTSLSEGDNAGAEKALTAALEADPTNKQLYYTIGTICIDLKDNAKAEQYLNRAIELDPKYEDALYQLGAHLVTWAGETRYSINSLEYGDPKKDALLKESDELYTKAIVPLEKYISIQPNDKTVLKILSQIYKSLKNEAKSLEYKNRADAVK